MLKNKSKKELRNFVSIFMALLITIIPLMNNAYASQRRYIPLWMEPNTIIIYDSSLNYRIVQGGELDLNSISGRRDIQAVGLTSTEPDMIAEPNIKVDYDLHGFIRNISYPSPGNPGEYQLSNPRAAKNNTGYLGYNESVVYGLYYNYDTGVRRNNILARNGYSDYIQGWGRITYYYDTVAELNDYEFQYGDCATKKEVCDVEHGAEVYAENTYADKSGYFTKRDVGKLPEAILDIWCDDDYHPITELTNTGAIDNVYTAYISASIEKEE